jgi:hypothetical protein
MHASIRRKVASDCDQGQRIRGNRKKETLKILESWEEIAEPTPCRVKDQDSGEQ